MTGNRYLKQLPGIWAAQGAEQRAVSIQLAFSFTIFIPLKLLDHGMMLLTFRVSLSNSLKPIKKSPSQANVILTVLH